MSGKIRKEILKKKISVEASEIQLKNDCAEIAGS